MYVEYTHYINMYKHIYALRYMYTHIYKEILCKIALAIMYPRFAINSRKIDSLIKFEKDFSNTVPSKMYHCFVSIYVYHLSHLFI